eukprot:INCI6187.3.p1 GENE.INCI6187.3~~INCI6187.3.p1  ORF type:complete len:134 (-),score=24.23 INCI6187.3:255-656(-)
MTTNSWQLQPRDYSTKQPQQQQQLQQAQQQGNSDNENMKTTNTKHNNDYHDHGSATCQYGNDNRHEVAAQQQQRAEAGRQRQSCEEALECLHAPLSSALSPTLALSLSLLPLSFTLSLLVLFVSCCCVRRCRK